MSDTAARFALEDRRRELDATLTPAEVDALRFAQEWRWYTDGLWHVVNDVGYASVVMARVHAEEDAVRWGDNPDAPYRAEPYPRPHLRTPE